LPWSLETTRYGFKINMAAMEVEEDKIDVLVKVEIGIQRQEMPSINLYLQKQCFLFLE